MTTDSIYSIDSTQYTSSPFIWLLISRMNKFYAPSRHLTPYPLRLRVIANILGCEHVVHHILVNWQNTLSSLILNYIDNMLFVPNSISSLWVCLNKTRNQRLKATRENKQKFDSISELESRNRTKDLRKNEKNDLRSNVVQVLASLLNTLVHGLLSLTNPNSGVVVLPIGSRKAQAKGISNAPFSHVRRFESTNQEGVLTCWACQLHRGYRPGTASIRPCSERNHGYPQGRRTVSW